MNTGGGNLVRLTDGVTDRSPRWSPDGTQIAFIGGRAAREDGTFASGIYVMNADGTNVRLIREARYNENDPSFSWSSDGTKIAFSAWLPGSGGGGGGERTIFIFTCPAVCGTNPSDGTNPGGGGTSPGGGGTNREDENPEPSLRVSHVAFTGTPAREETYRLGEQIRVAVTFNDAVTVTGTPQIGLTVGSATRQATYDATRSKGTLLVFTYTVQGTDADPDGISVAANALDPQRRHDQPRQ